jgi:hypothetical protein
MDGFSIQFTNKEHAMALSDPQSIKIGANTISLPRVETGKGESSYLSADGNTRLTLSSQYGSRTRRVVRVDSTKITTDPFIPANNVKVSMSNYLVFDIPPAGYTAAEAKEVYTGFIESLQATSAKIITQLLGGES